MADSGCEDTVPTISTMVPTCKLPEESDASMRARLFTSLSQSFPHSQLYKALHGGGDVILNGGDNSDDDDDSLYGDHLSNSCFASLRMDRRDSDDFDDDLRSLEWLQNEDLLKNIGGEKLDKEDDDNEEQKENEDVKPDISLLQTAPGQQAPNLQYLPQKHVNSKPPYSFSCLIFMAVEASPQKRLPVKDIYNWILTQFPYFQNAPTGWKNSVRHNLSLNKCFKKVEKDKGQSIGKGSLWCIDPAYRPNLLQALRKTPYHPYHQLQMTSTQPQNYVQYPSLPGSGRTVLPLTQRPVPNTVSPHLFPFLSRRLAQTSFDVDSEMKDVAQTLVALKSSYRKESPDSSSGEDIGPTWRHHKKSFRRPSSPVVVTGHPYDDHAYSSTRVLDDDDDDDVPSPSSSSSIDEEYDFGDADEECDSEYQSDMQWDSDDKDDVDGDLPSNKKLKIDMQNEGGSTSAAGKGSAAVVEESEDDEQKKIHEGASALLNLAGLLMNHHSSSTSPDAGSPIKKKENGSSEKEQRGEKKRRMSKKSRDESSKSVIGIQKKEEESRRKRSVSKRKNAGNNGKYDTEEYSLMKPGKASARNMSGNTSRLKSIKAKAPKSPAGVDPEVSSPPLKSKLPTKNSSNRKHGRKGPAGKHKLKLSKTFGALSKLADSVSDRNISATGGKTGKIITKSSVTKKELPKKGTSKKAQSSLLKKKADAENSGSITPENGNGHTASETSKPVLSSDSLNSNNIIKTAAYVHERHVTPQEKQLATSSVDCVHDDLRECGESSTDKVQTSALLPFANGEIISPAGDAPAKLREAAASARGERTAESRHTAQLSPSAASGSSNVKADTHGDATRASGSKNTKTGISNSPSATGAVHKSPHFTRFSKKKAALS